MRLLGTREVAVHFIIVIRTGILHDVARRSARGTFAGSRLGCETGTGLATRFHPRYSRVQVHTISISKAFCSYMIRASGLAVFYPTTVPQRNWRRDSETEQQLLRFLGGCRGSGRSKRPVCERRHTTPRTAPRLRYRSSVRQPPDPHPPGLLPSARRTSLQPARARHPPPRHSAAAPRLPASPLLDGKPPSCLLPTLLRPARPPPS